jgi:hypothetical protein
MHRRTLPIKLGLRGDEVVLVDKAQRVARRIERLRLEQWRLHSQLSLQAEMIESARDLLGLLRDGRGDKIAHLRMEQVNIVRKAEARTKALHDLLRQNKRSLQRFNSLRRGISTALGWDK